MYTVKPKRHAQGVGLTKRLEYLRSYLLAGSHKLVKNLDLRREEFERWRDLYLDPAWKFTCYLCKEKADHWHHIVLLSRGGLDSKDNLVTLCESCHKNVHRKVKVRPNREKKKGRKRRTKHLSPFIKPSILVEFVAKPPENNVLGNIFTQ